MYDRLRVDPAAAITIIDSTFYQRELQIQFETFLSCEVVRFVPDTASVDTRLKRNQATDPIGEQDVHVIYREFDDPTWLSKPPSTNSSPRSRWGWVASSG